MHPIFKISSKVSPIFRRKRIQKFLNLFEPTRETQILDVGGLPACWQGVPTNAKITLLNLYPLDAYDRSFMTANQTTVVGDGTKLPYEDQSFDIVFSNSVIEHVGTAARQALIAAEAIRVGKGYWVQTPAKEFFFEPHYFTPFIHWFPTHVQRRLLRNFTLWGLLGRPTPEVVDVVLSDLRLLRRTEFEQLFPGHEIWIERFLGMPKSYTAYKLPQTRPSRIREEKAERV
jgi:methyltransferase family protein